MRKSAMGLKLAAAITAMGLASPAQAEVINFDNLAGGTVVTNQYAGLGVTFSTVAGSQNLAIAAPFGTSAPNVLCSTAGGIDNCNSDVYVDFANAVSGLSFRLAGDNFSGDLGDVRVFDGAVLLGTVDLIGNASPFSNLVDLTTFASITRIEIVGVTDQGGLVYDDFTFTSLNAAVPEPATWAMMLLGFGAAGLAFRRRRPRQLVNATA